MKTESPEPRYCLQDLKSRCPNLQVEGWILTYEKIQESRQDDHVHPPQERHLHIGLANDGKQYYLDAGSGLFLQQSHRFDCKEKPNEIHFRLNTTDTELPVGQIMRFNLGEKPETIFGAERVEYFVGEEPLKVDYYISGKKEPYHPLDDAPTVSPANTHANYSRKDDSEKANKSSHPGSIELPPAFRL